MSDDRLLRPGAAPLDWSPSAYKMTLGIGALGMTAIMADLWTPPLSFWIIAIVTMTPFMVFTFVTLNGCSPRTVRWAHVAASIWYLLAATFLVASLLLRNTASAEPPAMWILMPIFLGVGATPCAIVLVKALSGRYCVERRP